MYSSITPRRTSASFAVWVVTCMPSATGVVHEAGRPFMPSICTRHRRHEPNASNCSVAHSFGIFVPNSAAARSTEVPSGTVTGCPSMVSVMSGVPTRAGVPKSWSTIDCMRHPLHAPLRAANYNGLGGRAGAFRFDKILGKMVQGREHRVGRQAAERA